MKHTHARLVHIDQVALRVIDIVINDNFLQGNSFVALQVAAFQHLKASLVNGWENVIVHWCEQQGPLLRIVDDINLRRFTQC